MVNPTITLMPTQTRILPTLISTPTTVIPTDTSTPTLDLGSLLNSPDFTQTPAAITTHEAANNKYIYKYADVTFIIPFRDETLIRLNLDNLNDNGEKTSDVIIDHSTGSGGTFLQLYPLNGTTYYFSDLHAMSYDSCMEHFPFTNMDPDRYSDQAWGVDSHRDYCILTGDGHLAILRYVDDIYLPDDWDHVNFEIVVTTYKQIVPQVLTPMPTYTPGPSPTPNRYTGMNLTHKQELALDKAAQAFLDAVASYDKEKVADLMEYPLTVYYEGYEYPDTLNTREEFLAAYDSIFTHDLVEEFKQATLQENMGIHVSSALSILVKDGLIVFYPNGKISEISNSSYWWKNENK
jgi:hypothetical protein